MLSSHRLFGRRSGTNSRRRTRIAREEKTILGSLIRVASIDHPHRFVTTTPRARRLRNGPRAHRTKRKKTQTELNRTEQNKTKQIQTKPKPKPKTKTKTKQNKTKTRSALHVFLQHQQSRARAELEGQGLPVDHAAMASQIGAMWAKLDQVRRRGVALGERRRRWWDAIGGGVWSGGSPSPAAAACSRSPAAARSRCLSVVGAVARFFARERGVCFTSVERARHALP